MMKWNVEPLKSVNGVNFGEDREKARNIIGLNFKEFKKTKFSKNTTDDFGVCHIFYSAENKVEAIEIFPSVEIMIKNKSVFPNSLDVLKSIVSDLMSDGSEYISVSKSIGISMDGEKMDSILFGCPDYYK